MIIKSQIQVFLLYLLILSASSNAQPKLSFDIGMGFYEPSLSGFDDNSSVQFPTKTLVNRNPTT